MTAQYVRERYKVPAKVGTRVEVEGRHGVIVSFPGQYLGVRFTDDPRRSTIPCHPTWRVVYGEHIPIRKPRTPATTPTRIP